MILFIVEINFFRKVGIQQKSFFSLLKINEILKCYSNELKKPFMKYENFITIMLQLGITK